LDFRRFADRALSELESVGGPKQERMGHGLRETLSVASASRHPRLTAESIIERPNEIGAGDVSRLEAVILKDSLDWQCARLTECLADCPLPEATFALVRLASADKSKAWWTALQGGRARAALGPKETWPRILKVRNVIATGFADSKAADQDLIEDAKKLLPSLVTRDFEWSDPEGFRAAVRALAEQYDKDTSTKLLIDYLKTAKDELSEEESVFFCLKYVNKLNGVNIGKLGKDVDRLWGPYAGKNMIQVVNDAVKWYGRRGLQPETPAPYKVKDGDLRIVGYRTDDPDSSMIGLWVYEENPREANRTQTVTAGRYVMNYEVSVVHERGNDGGHRAILYNAGAGFKDEDGTGGGVYGIVFWASELPKSEKGISPWRIVIERAPDPKSVLSGRKVFEDWWKEYSPAAAGDKAPEEPPGK
jgi:hypothetical protein